MRSIDNNNKKNLTQGKEKSKPKQNKKNKIIFLNVTNTHNEITVSPSPKCK